MASYKVVFKPFVEKDLRVLPRSTVGRVFKQIEALQAEPFPRQSIKLAGAEQLSRPSTLCVMQCRTIARSRIPVTGSPFAAM